MIENRKRIAIFCDYSLRIPAINNAFGTFKNELFSDKQYEFNSEDEGVGEVNFYWREQLKVKEVEEFYMKAKIEKDDYELKSSEYKEFFYNEEHWKKFMEDYSFNIYADAEICCKKDIDYLNIIQDHLFDVIVVDEFITKRKKANTLYFLSKSRIFPQAVLFLGPGQTLNESTYYGIWNPKINSEQYNKEGFGDFEMWLRGMELDWKRETFGTE